VRCHHRPELLPSASVTITLSVCESRSPPGVAAVSVHHDHVSVCELPSPPRVAFVGIRDDHVEPLWGAITTRSCCRRGPSRPRWAYVRCLHHPELLPSPSVTTTLSVCEVLSTPGVASVGVVQRLSRNCFSGPPRDLIVDRRRSAITNPSCCRLHDHTEPLLAAVSTRCYCRHHHVEREWAAVTTPCYLRWCPSPPRWASVSCRHHPELLPSSPSWPCVRCHHHPELLPSASSNDCHVIASVVPLATSLIAGDLLSRTRVVAVCTITLSLCELPSPPGVSAVCVRHDPTQRRRSTLTNLRCCRRLPSPFRWASSNCRHEPSSYLLHTELLPSASVTIGLRDVERSTQRWVAYVGIRHDAAEHRWATFTSSSFLCRRK